METSTIQKQSGLSRNHIFLKIKICVIFLKHLLVKVPQSRYYCLLLQEVSAILVIHAFLYSKNINRFAEPQFLKFFEPKITIND